MAERLGFHEDYRRPEGVAGPSDRDFGLVFTAVCALVGVVKLWHGSLFGVWWLAAALALLLVTLLRPRTLSSLNRLWLKFGLFLSQVTTPLVLGALFYGVFTPIGLLIRALRKDLLHLHDEGQAGSYWIERRPPGPAPDTMRNQF